MIDEKVIIFFILLVIKPVVLANTADKMIKIGVKNEDMRDSRIKGAIFCQVKKTISWGQWSESAIIGAHEWRGAMAPFRAKVNIMVTEYMELEERGVLEDVITISVAIIAEAEA